MTEQQQIVVKLEEHWFSWEPIAIVVTIVLAVIGWYLTHRKKR